MTSQDASRRPRGLARWLLSAFLVAVPAASAVADEWLSVHNWPVPPSDHRTTIAISQNPDGFVAGFYRDVDRRVRIYLALPEENPERLISSGLVALYRGNEGRGSDIKLPDTLNPKETGFTDGRTVTGSIWHGDGPTAYAGTFRDILNSKTLCARFFTFSGQQDTCWDLSGLHNAVEDAIQITAAVSPEDQAWHELRAAVAISGMSRCTPANHLSCTPIFDHCFARFEQHKDVAMFNDCMAVVE
ncbi:hypothetical protein [Limimaricola cinnabarinus]|uniref:hypothetical protein n=1 Tax=Limimaricola cinnabarinus TaxID=1125964 RepID=UPI0013A62286|nr:hypothetical protein [Limimaricola cinnabarinus]